MKMLGKTKKHACPYGCCDADFAGSGKANKRLAKKRLKLAERAKWLQEEQVEDVLTQCDKCVTLVLLVKNSTKRKGAIDEKLLRFRL